ncbi:cellulase family glycosylhydrolase [Methylobacterium sp. WL103]|uniref:glycoside hydrolase family 5 protein n=1 Tax=Methylobacterium sp. WL103 TaxID=2603891 RepID=UPI001FEE639F|nr:cellulase family glycosylhydrolase [Methylobacterium sp. WL103]
MIAVLFPVLVVTWGSAPADAADPADAIAMRMGPGVNILGYDGVWEGGTDAPFRRRYFRMIAQAGFRHVRINLYAFKYLDAANQLDPALLRRLDWVLEQTIAAGLIPVIDEHDFEICQADAHSCTTKLKAFWNQVVARYGSRYPEAVYEILNEPGGNINQATWNSIVADTLAIIRKASPHRTVIVAALNTEAPLADRLPTLPDTDRNLIVTVHYYAPMQFTHQGAPWSPEFRSKSPVGWGSMADRLRMSADLEQVGAWARAVRRPIYLGEFGVYDAAPASDRARYVGSIAATAYRLGWPFAYWQFDHDFALYDTVRERWNEPVLRKLVPRGVIKRGE